MTEKSFTWNSSDYAKHSSAQSEWGQELIDKLRLKGTESVLDIGCGAGNLTVALANALPQGRVVGIDSSESMIESSKARSVDSLYDNVTFMLMDATELQFENQFDVAFSNAALHWIKNQTVMLEGVKKSLKQGGRILFQMGAKGNAQDVLDTLETLMEKEKWRPYFKDFSFPYAFYEPKEYERLLLKVGLEPSRLERIPKDLIQDGKDGLAGWVRTTWLPYLERIPEPLREILVSEIIDSYLQAFPLDSQGKAHVAMARLEIEAINP